MSASRHEVLVVSIAFWARRFAGRAAITADVAAFGDDCFYGGLNSIMLEDSFPKGVKLL